MVQQARTHHATAHYDNARVSCHAGRFWLVDGKATNVVVKRMISGWYATTKQDKRITENNQAGILSMRYHPGRYSKHERRVVTSRAK
jgi:phenylpropionate dioxygenase-like ring-hydroxylating dioxygenase large terminal subunit